MRDALKPDPVLGEALRRLDRAPTLTPAELDGLVARVLADAGPELAHRRRGTISWWEYTVAWARVLFAVGMATSLVAAACLLWASVVRPADLAPRAAARTASLGAARAADVGARIGPDQLLGALVLSSPVDGGGATR
ncbi:MAG TPA: hypothetical protein VG818_00875 [Gemmatimonadaceae bacterium]|jgi:hypothetical protein|nr:hypothetical protein [Gemmatimonadaceae bacterium]